ncbi:MAG: hypothetical protein ACXVGH_13965 [Mycobacteriales bacterium]
MSDLHEVHLLQLPVRVWAQAQETTEALLREFTLISLGGDLQTHEVPARLLALIDLLTERFQGISTEQELALRDAAEAGRMVIEDLRYDVPAEVSDGVQALGALLDEADAYCEQGQHLLTVAATPEVVRFRQWFLAQFSEQVAGRPATAWPDWP